MIAFILSLLASGAVLVVGALVLAVLGWREAVWMLALGLAMELVSLFGFLLVRFYAWHETLQRKNAILVLLFGGLVVMSAAVLSLLRSHYAEWLLVLGLTIETVALVAYFLGGKKRNYPD